MTFDQTIKLLDSRLKGPLPGPEAQHQMAPYNRPTGATIREADPDPKLSAVLALLFPDQNIPHLVLMLRNSYKGVHSAQVSLPGGKLEPNDNSLQDTALRETEEEIGISRSNISVIGKLTEVYIPPSRFLVQPFVGYVEGHPQFDPSEDEVAELITLPLFKLLDDSIVKETLIPVQNGAFNINAPYFEIHQHKVWGATAMMLSELKILLTTN